MIRKRFIAIVAILCICFFALGVLNASKNNRPVVQLEYNDLASLLKVEKLYNKKIELYQLNKDIKQLKNPPQELLTYKKNLERDIKKILNNNS